MMPKQKKETKNYILANIDKYVIDGRGNFYWEDAEEGMEYIYENELNVLDKVTIMMEISKRIFETKEDWGLDFIKDDIHVWPVLFYKNKKDGRIMYALHIWYTDSKGFSVGKSINDYKGTDKMTLELLEVRGIINEEQQKILDKWRQEIEQTIKKSREFREKYDEEERKKKAERIRYEEEQQKMQVLWEKQQNQIPIPTEARNSLPIPKSSSPVESYNSEATNQTIDIQFIANNTNMEEIHQEIKRQIYQLLASNKLKTSDLPQQYQNWKEQLKNLSSKEGVIDYSQNLQRVITEQGNSSNKQQPASNGFSSPTKLIIGIGVGLTVTGIAFLVLKRRISLNSKKRK